MVKMKYAELDDIEKIEKQWHKMSGLHSREDWSAAMVRAATAAEIAANFAVREEFRKRSKFDVEFVDKLLKWANGIDGKLIRLLVPLHAGRKNARKISGLKELSARFNKQRNEIVHSGHFMNKKEAEDFIENAKKFVETLVQIYEPNFELEDHESVDR